MSKNLSQVFSTNPITTIGNTDLIYVVVGGLTDAGMSGSSLKAQFANFDGHGNLFANNFLSGYTTTTASAGTTTLTVSSTFQQFFTGSNSQTVLLPVVSTLTLGQSFYIVNNVSGFNVTIESSGANTVQVLSPLTSALVTCVQIVGTDQTSWSVSYFNSASMTLPLSLANGGTGANNSGHLGGIVYSTANAFTSTLATATANQVVLSGANAAPSFSTATYPVTTTINQLLYSSAANTIGGLATVTSAVLTTVLGVPTWSAELSLALGGTNAALTASNGGIFYSTGSAGAILAGTATAGLALLSGANTTPSWSTLPPITKINVQTITATGAFSYTPTTGTKYATFELQAAGGGSAGCQGGSSVGSVAAGGGGGGYQKILITGSANLAAITGTIGAGGTAGASGLNNGGAGGNTTLVVNSGSTWTSAGGAGGPTQGSSASATKNGGTLGGGNASGTNGTLIIAVNGGDAGIGFIGAAAAVGASFGSCGGASFLGKSIQPTTLGQIAAAGYLYGGGAAGGANGTGGNIAGAVGAQGVVIVTEYISI